MLKERALFELKSSKQYIDRVLRVFTEPDSGFAPADGGMTVAQQVAHIARTVDWFVDALHDPAGFDLDFERHAVEVAKVTSIEEAKAWLNRAYDAAVSNFGGLSQDDLEAALPDGPIMGGEPKYAMILGIIDHTAHHRGALSVYARCQGKTPPMPYMDL